MAMLRSALGRASRRLSASEILKPPLSNTAPWVPRPGPAAHLTRAFTSPAAAAPGAPTRRIPNLQIQRRFFSAERKEPVLERLEKWLDNTIEPWHVMSLVAVIGLSSFVATTIAYHRLGTSVMDIDTRGGAHATCVSQSRSYLQGRV